MVCVVQYNFRFLKSVLNYVLCTGMTPRSGTTRWSLLLRQTEQLDPAWYQDMCFHGGMVLGVLVGQSSSTMEIHTLRHIFKGKLIYFGTHKMGG